MKIFKNKLKIAKILLLFFGCLATIVTLTTPMIGKLSAILDIDETTYHTVTYEGHKFRCYTLVDSENPTDKKVAIAWLYATDDTPNVIPATLNVPSEVSIDGETYTVSAVLKGGFRDCTFTTINLPKTIEEIGEEAFAYCKNMTSFSIPHNVTRIAPSTFMDCQELEIFYYTGLEDENDPDSAEVKRLGNSVITEIGDHAFDNCVKLKGLYFPSSLRIIGNSAFQRCSLLQSLFFPSGNVGNTNTLTIGSYAFADCPLLGTVYFERKRQILRRNGIDKLCETVLTESQLYRSVFR